MDDLELHQTDARREVELPSGILGTNRSDLLHLDRLALADLPGRVTSHRHVQALTQDIAVAGLLENLVVDRDGHVIAGRHRLAAIRCLREQDAEAFDRHFPQGRIPVTVLPLRASEDPLAAIAAMVSENAIRRQASPKDVCDLYNAFVSAGFHAGRGRPVDGTQTATEAVASLFGRSRDWVKYVRRQHREARAGEIALERAQDQAEEFDDEADEADEVDTPIARGAGRVAEEVVRTRLPASVELEAAQDAYLLLDRADRAAFRAWLATLPVELDAG